MSVCSGESIRSVVGPLPLDKTKRKMYTPLFLNFSDLLYRTQIWIGHLQDHRRTHERRLWVRGCDVIRPRQVTAGGDRREPSYKRERCCPGPLGSDCHDFPRDISSTLGFVDQTKEDRGVSPRGILLSSSLVTFWSGKKKKNWRRA